CDGRSQDVGETAASANIKSRECPATVGGNADGYTAISKENAPARTRQPKISTHPSRPDGRNGLFHLLQSDRNILGSMCGGYGALFGGDGHEEHSQFDQCAPQLNVSLEIVMLQYIVKIYRCVRHQIVRQRRPLTCDAGGHAVRAENIPQTGLQSTAQLFNV